MTMGVSTETLNRAVAAARSLEQQGYFEKARQGDQTAASLFARLTAYTLNPNGDGDDYGCLSKSPGETQVDGFAEDAICYTDNPADRINVVDLIQGAGAPGAAIGGSVKERRENNKWVKPVPLSDAQMAYLRPGVPPTPQPPAFKPREQFYAEFRQINAYYEAQEGLQRRGGMVIDTANPVRCDHEAMGAWGYDLMTGTTVEQAIYRIRHSDEWRSKHPGETP